MRRVVLADACGIMRDRRKDALRCLRRSGRRDTRLGDIRHGGRSNGHQKGESVSAAQYGRYCMKRRPAAASKGTIRLAATASLMSLLAIAAFC